MKNIDKKEITYSQLKKMLAESKDNRYEITFKYGPYTDRKTATTVIYAPNKNKALHKFEISKEHEYYSDFGLDDEEDPGDIYITDVKEFRKSWKQVYDTPLNPKVMEESDDLDRLQRKHEEEYQNDTWYKNKANKRCVVCGARLYGDDYGGLCGECYKDIH